MSCHARLKFGGYYCGDVSPSGTSLVLCDRCSGAALDARNGAHGAPPNGASRSGEDTGVSVLPAIERSPGPLRTDRQHFGSGVDRRDSAPSAAQQKQPQQNGSAHGSPSAAPLGAASVAPLPLCEHVDCHILGRSPCPEFRREQQRRARAGIDDGVPDRVIERESSGPHVAPCSCDESLALRRRLRAAEKLLTDAQKVALALVNYGDEFAVAGALSGGIRSALRALHGEL